MLSVLHLSWFLVGFMGWALARRIVIDLRAGRWNRRLQFELRPGHIYASAEEPRDYVQIVRIEPSLMGRTFHRPTGLVCCYVVLYSSDGKLLDERGTLLEIDGKTYEACPHYTSSKLSVERMLTLFTPVHNVKAVKSG